jgi:hypothetical protein
LAININIRRANLRAKTNHASNPRIQPSASGDAPGGG